MVETGLSSDGILGVEEMSQLSGRPVHEVVRLETVFEELLRQTGSAEKAVRSFPQVLHERTANAVGVKSIVAYRFGFDFDPSFPSVAEAVRAAGDLLRSGEDSSVRVVDPVLLRFLLWSAVERGLPIQLHSGYGDPDLELHRCDPLLLTRFIKLVEPHAVDLLLLHCYPYHRNAGYLAQSFPHVYFDVGLGTNYTGLRSHAVIAESLELAPFAKILFSSDAVGPAELHHLGAALWRRGMIRAMKPWVADREMSVQDAHRIATMIGRENAARLYGIEGTQ
ncbi:amidohydrolase family protein [Streptomyces sp. NPDC001508]|uniref:amidohydrolase family protein n=1 Tax=Streptomyces sp. NPDC001508 TaxID=3154656 RepID=UPI003322FCE1